MRLAELPKLDVAPSTLVHTNEGERYVTRRVNRLVDGFTLRQDDMTQMTERLTEDKYRRSHEQIGKANMKHCTLPRVELVLVFRSVVYCFLTSNNDAQLKNWSLTQHSTEKCVMTSLYDQFAVRLMLPEKLYPEELALPLSGRRSEFTRSVFFAFPQSYGTGVAKLLSWQKPLLVLR